MNELALEIRHLAKRFPPNVIALTDASLTVRPGEVHCLLGANGAGKSTLLKIVAGAHRPDGGEMLVGGRQVELKSPQQAREAGIVMIYQELDLIGQMTVEENLMLGYTPSRFGVISRAKRSARAALALKRVGAHFSATARVETLSIANQQLTAIARALTCDAKLVVMDEPSAALNETELKRVFQVIREITAAGVAVLYVSHRLHEIREIGHRVTVLRGGCTLETRELSDVDDQALINAVVGEHRALLERSARTPPRAELALKVDNLHGAQGLDVHGLEVRQGEIVGLAGLNGAGRSSLLKALFGSGRFTGNIQLFGHAYKPNTPRDAIRLGVGLVPESRKTEGLMLDAPIYRNATLVHTHRLTWFSHWQAKQRTEPVLKRLQTKFDNLDQPVRQLSGGNQQKVVMAKWVIEGTRLLLLDEPSRGLDVGAKADLYALARSLAQEGSAVLVASSELDELYVNCDRIWVMHEGRNAECFDPLTTPRDHIEHAILTGKRVHTS
ncbi:sugar ABC transporter ATP-binding protein [Pseudomonas sp. CCI3.2]|uniref:sugar ABC transporter ATP-binding protein n=1 Tax=unclassified Pseudomonas TaxID=196821 RepID=UPI002AC98A46|nr:MULTISPECIES: sugar ABC transporter ATP-binding protein [unclassified Pseudomonas]MEB0077181.1 sugar ABC transporter ATP-binding protein [Pseudomonas sp. MH10out]MEB0093021.1 sugar ABC transporter ATP-binding protein [Pseudomonas sp. CCI4.2]MEB0101528.1 sugar ABC transporter ATP-binding protein [Pseudomonas sp. CCI3.2]MEB0129356.1 sugar ABC transporter ATP-binding protein [Pseudomonas sp. CCI2.4]MEB0158790.1 sugar ABC transporter ATP-binding protein [Pseudomonas sp. AH2 (2023)]